MPRRRELYILSTVMLAAIAARSVAAQEPARTIRVSGEGTATTPPDMATVFTGVVTQASEASQALTANNAALKKLMDVLQEHRIAAKDIQTASFDVHPEYRHDPRGQQQPEIVGYRVTNQVRVAVRNLPDLGRVLDALVRAGSNQISGISFGVDDSTGVLNQARNRAIADARSRAELYAHAAGVRVGKVITITEQPLQPPQPMMMMGRAMAAEAMSAVPVATGEQEMRTTVSMVFALEDSQ
jgi:uncharacterized protein YggE